jgi:hypothetical protein
MHDAEIHSIISATLEAVIAGRPSTPEQAKIINGAAIEIMVRLQIAGFQIKKRGKNADRR